MPAIADMNVVAEVLDHDPLLTRPEAAAQLGVTPAELSYMTDHGVIPAVRLPGGHRRWRQSAVDAAKPRE